MPRVDAGKGSGRIIKTGNIKKEQSRVKPSASASQRANRLSLFIDPDHWADAPVTVILSGCTWISSGGNQRPVAMARELVKAGHHVIYSCGAQPKIQYAGNALIVCPNRLQDEITPILPSNGTVLCTLPTPKYLELCEGFADNGWRVIYDVLDDWKAFAADGEAGWYREELERALMKHADAVTASAPKLQERVKDWVGRDATLVPNGGPSEAFKERPVPADMLRGSEGSVVYSGYLAGSWFHWYMLAQTVRDLPDVGFTIVGAADGCKLPEAPNLRFVGAKPYHRAMDYVANADVGIIPFQSDAVCEAVDPIKWYDYIAGGCWTVATWSLADVHGRPFTEICPKGALSMAPQIEKVLSKPRVTREEANEVLRSTDASWGSRTRRLMETVGIRL